MHWFAAQIVVLFTTLCYSSSYLPIVPNESEVSENSRKIADFHVVIYFSVYEIISDYYGQTPSYQKCFKYIFG